MIKKRLGSVFKKGCGNMSKYEKISLTLMTVSIFVSGIAIAF